MYLRHYKNTSNPVRCYQPWTACAFTKRISIVTLSIFIELNFKLSACKLIGYEFNFVFVMVFFDPIYIQKSKNYEINSSAICKIVPATQFCRKSIKIKFVIDKK